MSDFSSALSAALADRYVIDRELGRGGMATVYLARDLRHDRAVALKVLHPAVAHALGPERFLREIKLAARLQHPNILSVHDSGEVHGQFWFTMPYVEGESLRARLGREHQLPLDDALRITAETAEALDCAHRHGIIHRDIKPENILLSERHALVADFGVSQALGADRPGERLTETGTVVGTPIYMSPEQAAGERALDARTDIYSLGVVLYELLAGEPPYAGPTAQAILAKRIRDPVPSVRRARPVIPEHVDRALERALSPVPADRFSTAAEFAEALRATATSTTVTSSVSPNAPGQPPASPSRYRPRMAVVLALGFLLGLGVLFGWLHSQRAVGEGVASKRLAVLPFESPGDTAERVFAGGISDEIMTRLARVPGLSLVGRSSALQYRRSGQTAPQFGRTLGVDYVLDGTVRSAAGPDGRKLLRIIPELIKVADGTHVWGEAYEGHSGDVFRLQADVAERVAEALRGTIGSNEQRAVRAEPSNDLEAFRLYTLGRAEWNRRTPESLEQAAEYFHQAIGRDSAFARAWAGLADAYALYDYYGVRSLSPDTAYARAKAAALRAIALDSMLAEPHASLNQILRFGYWDWAGSEREVRRAIALDSNYATAHKWLAEHLLTFGRFPEAIAEARTAVRLDPLAQPPQVTLATALWYGGKVDEAITVFRAALVRDPTAPLLVANLFLLYLSSGRIDEALVLLAARRDTSSFRRTLVRAPNDPAVFGELLRDLETLRNRRSPLDTARVYALIGNRPAALSALERALAERYAPLDLIRVEPVFAPLRRDPRFGAILARMGLPR